MQITTLRKTWWRLKSQPLNYGTEDFSFDVKYYVSGRYYEAILQEKTTSTGQTTVHGTFGNSTVTYTRWTTTLSVGGQTVASYQYSTSYLTSTKGTIPSLLLFLVGGEDLSNPAFVEWLEANADPVDLPITLRGYTWHFPQRTYNSLLRIGSCNIDYLYNGTVYHSMSESSSSTTGTYNASLYVEISYGGSPIQQYTQYTYNLQLGNLNLTSRRSTTQYAGTTSYATIPEMQIHFLGGEDINNAALLSLLLEYGSVVEYPSVEVDALTLSLEPGTHILHAKAVAPDIAESASSNSITYVLLPKLDTPVIIGIEGTIATISVDDNAQQCEYFVDGDSIGTQDIE